jgi:hypothetical protein
MIILRKRQKEYALSLSPGPGKKRAIKLWLKDRFLDGLEEKERKELTSLAGKAKTKLGRYIFAPA